MEVIECLQTDQDDLRYRMIDLMTDAKEGVSAQQNAFRELASLAAAQAKAIEAVVIPHVQCAGEEANGVRSFARKCLEEQDLLEELSYKIGRTLDHEQWNAKLNIYGDLLENHLREVEVKLLPELFDRLTDEERNELGRRYVDYRDHGMNPASFIKSAC